jgi:hypothetical protein
MTCRAVGAPIQEYLTWALKRVGTHRDVFVLPIGQLTPAAFKRARTPRLPAAPPQDAGLGFG